MNYNNVKFTAAYGTFEQLPQSSKPEIAFAGRSNVGKSSLMNCLFSRKNLVRTSSVPGKTITINFFEADGIYFADLPGYGYAKRNQSEKKRWASLMEGYFTSGRNISLVVQLIDMRHAPSQDDYTMLNFLKESGLDFVIVLTKCDKLNKGELEQRRNAFREELKDYADITTVEFSSVTGNGINEIREIIEKHSDKN